MSAPSSTERVSIHESAHAVVAALHDVEIVSVTLRPGRTTFPAPIVDQWVQLLVCLASAAAEEHAFGDVDEAGQRWDRASADVAAYRVGGWDRMANVIAEADLLVRDLVDRNWPEIERTALQLLAAPDGALHGIGVLI